MKISQSVTISKPLPVVWAFFQDVPQVAVCMPGAELLEDRGEGVYSGRLTIKLGPFRAAFEGEAEVTEDPANHTGHVIGKGIDKRGGSRSKMIMDYGLVGASGETTVTIKADVQLSGPIAQFGRSGIIDETAAILIGQFVENVEAKLAAPQDMTVDEGGGRDAASERPAPVQGINAISIFWSLVKSLFKRLAGK